MRKSMSSQERDIRKTAQDARLIVPTVPDFASRAVEIGVLSDLGNLFAEQQATTLGGASEESAIEDLMISLFDEAIQSDPLLAPRREI